MIAGSIEADSSNLVDNGDGTFSFTPDTNAGEVQLTYNVTDGSPGTSSTGSYSFNILPVNDPPAARTDSTSPSASLSPLKFKRSIRQPLSANQRPAPMDRAVAAMKATGPPPTPSTSTLVALGTLLLMMAPPPSTPGKTSPQLNCKDCSSSQLLMPMATPPSPSPLPTPGQRISTSPMPKIPSEISTSSSKS